MIYWLIKITPNIQVKNDLSLLYVYPSPSLLSSNFPLAPSPSLSPSRPPPPFVPPAFHGSWAYVWCIVYPFRMTRINQSLYIITCHFENICNHCRTWIQVTHTHTHTHILLEVKLSYDQVIISVKGRKFYHTCLPYICRHSLIFL